MAKFRSERHISYSLKRAFIRWKKSTVSWKTERDKNIKYIGRYRHFISIVLSYFTKEGAQSGLPAAAVNSEGKTTDEGAENRDSSERQPG